MVWTLKDDEDLARLIKREPSPAWLESLGKLSDHLDDTLLVVALANAPFNPLRLLPIVTNDHQWLLLALDNKQAVLFDQNLKIGHCLSLGDFESAKDQLMTATFETRAFSNAPNLWLSVCRWEDQTPGLRLYSAEIGPELKLIPLGPSPKTWKSQTSRIPPTLAQALQLNLQLPPDVSLLLQYPQLPLANIPLADGRAEHAVVAAAPNFLAYSRGDETLYVQPGQPIQVPVGGGIRALAIDAIQERRVKLVVAGNDRQIYGYEAKLQPDGWHLSFAWSHILPALPRAVTFLGPRAKLDWRDVAVSLRDGQIWRLCYEPWHLRLTWKQAWRSLRAALGITDLERFCSWIGELTSPHTLNSWAQAGASLRGRAAISVAFFEEILRAQRTGTLNPRIVDMLAQIIRDDQPGHLAKLLERALRDPRTVPLVAKIYESEVALPIQERIDLTVRQLLADDPKPDHQKALEPLKSRSRTNRLDLLDSRETSSQRKAFVYLEQWAQPLLLTDLLALGEREHSGTRPLTWLWNEQGATHLVSGAKDYLTITQITRGKESNARPYRWSHTLKNPYFIRALKLNGGPGLLLAAADGTLQTLHWRDASLTTCHQTQLPTPSAGGPCDIQVVSHYPNQAGGGLLVLGATRQKQALLAVYQVDPQGQIVFKDQKMLTFTLVRSLDLAFFQDHYLLAVGTGGEAQLHFYRIDHLAPKLTPLTQQPLHFSQRVTIARFDHHQNPDQVLIAQRGGWLTCASLKDQKPDQKLWSYQLDGEIRGMVPFTADDDRHCALCNEQGKMVVLRLKDGRRLWTTRLPADIRSMGANAGDYLAAAMVDGQGAIFKAITADERQRSLTLLHQLLPQVEVDDTPGGWQGDHEALQAIHGLRQDTTLADVLSRVHQRRVRPLVIRYGLEVHAADLQELPETFLTWRDLGLALAYLPDQVTRWDAIFFQQLQTFNPADEKADNSPKAEMQVLALWVQRLGRKGLTPEQLLSQVGCPKRLSDPSFRWVQWELARCLLASIDARRPQSSGERLDLILRHFQTLPPAVLLMVPQVLTPADGLWKAISALCRLIEAVNQPRRPKPSDLATVREELSDGKGGRAGHLLAVIAEIFEYSNQDDWKSLRNKALATLRKLHQVLHQNTEGPAQAELQRLLRATLPERPFPADTQSLQERQAWLAEGLASRPQPGANSGFWTQAITRLAHDTHQIILRFLGDENNYCAALTRPRVQLKGAERDPSGNVRLHLEVTGEGKQNIDHVTLGVDAEIDQGLGGESDQRKTKLWRATFRPHHFREAITLSGYVPDTQTQVKLRCWLDGEKGLVRHEEIWTFQLPPPRDIHFTLTPLGQLPETLDYWLHQITKEKTSAVWVVDLELGQAGLAQRLQERGIPVWNLDQAYPRASRQSRSHLLEALGTFAELGPAPYPSTPPPLAVIGPTHQTWARAPAALEATLASWAERKQLTRHWLLTHRDWVEVRAKLPDKMPVYWLDRLPATHTIGKEVETWLAHQAGAGHPLARRVVQELGSSLSLLAYWANWYKRSAATVVNQGLDAFFGDATTQTWARQQLADLTGPELLHLMAGAIYRVELPPTRLKVGMVLAETEATEKLLVDEALIEQRKKNKTNTVVKAYSDGRGEPAYPSHLSRFIPNTDPKVVAQLTRWQLVRSEEFSRSAYSVWPPLGRHLEGEYKRALPAHAQELDHCIFRAFSKRSLLTAITPEVISQASADQIQALLPFYTPEDQTRFQTLAKSWNDNKPPSAELLNQTLGQPISLLPAESPFGALWALVQKPSQIFSVGPPREDHFWGHLIVFLAQGHTVAPEALDSTLDTIRKDRAGTLSSIDTPVEVWLMGPGAVQPDPSRRFAYLSWGVVASASETSEGLGRGLVREARKMTRLSIRSPYVSAGALPPNSPLFVGRKDELTFIAERLRKHSILITGGRRLGKTSLLWRAMHQAASSDNLMLFYADAQGAATGLVLEKRLKLYPEGRQIGSFITAVDMAKRQNRLAGFFLNEIDEVLRNDSNFFTDLRRYNDSGDARFVMVAYTSALGGIRQANHALYHFAEGPKGEPAITLAQLAEDAADELIRLLEGSSLSLRWKSEEDKSYGYRILRERTYRIPWLLQRCCHQVVELLEEERQDQITRVHIDAAVALNRGQLLRDFLDLEFDWVIKEGLGDLSPNQVAALREAIFLVLYIVARDLYFVGRQEAHNLPTPDDNFYFFYPQDAVDGARAALQRLLVPTEYVRVDDFFRRLDWSRIFQRLTLTLLLDVHPNDPEQFGFRLHIFPLELGYQHGGTDPLADLIIRSARGLLEKLR